MTLSVSTQVSPIGTKLIKEDDANATAQNNVTGTSGKIYMAVLDNSGNPTEAVYLKIYDNAAPTVGSTDPDFIIRAPQNQRVNMVFPDGLDFTTLSFAVVTAGGTSGTTNPSFAVEVQLVTS